MVETSLYLLFEINKAGYAVEAGSVREIILLPKLSFVEELPEYVTGAFNYRGVYIPVLDINLRMRRDATSADINSKVLILSYGAHLFGLIIHESLEVIPLDKEQIQSVTDRISSTEAAIMQGAAFIENRLINILDLARLIKENTPAPPQIPADNAPRIPDIYRDLFSAPLHEALFSERAVSISHRKDSETEVESGNKFVLFRLNNELLALPVTKVKGFAAVKSVTEVPCCPDHIAGQINYRGSALTVIDLRIFLKMKPDNFTDRKVIIVDFEGEDIGIIAEDISDIRSVNVSDTGEVPVVVKNIAKEFISGTFPYEGRLVGIINIDRILSDENLVVNETVQ